MMDKPPGQDAPRSPSEKAMDDRVTGLYLEFGTEATVELLQSFLVDTPKRLAELEALAGGSDREALARTAHSLAGSSSIFGLEAMREECLQLEAKVRESQGGAFDGPVQSIQRTFTAFRPLLERYVTGNSAQPGA